MAICATPAYLTGSWKGLAFDVDSNDDSFERGSWLGEYPFRDTTSTTDTGMKAKKFTVKGSFNDGDHVVRAVAFRAAFEAGGDGLLVHPIWGPVQVLATSLKFSHNVREKKRQTEFTLECIESGSVFSLISLAGFAAIANIFAPVLAVATTLFNANWNGNSATINVANTVSANAATGAAPITTKSEFDARDVLAMRPVLWRTTPSAMLLHVSTLVTAIEDRPEPSVRLMEFVETFPKIIANDANGPAINSLHLYSIMTAAMTFSEVVDDKVYTTINEAWVDLDWLIQRFDVEMGIAATTCNTDLYSALFKARSEILGRLMKGIIELPGVIEHDLGIELPSLLAAHRIYGDSTRAVQLQNYNPGSNPVSMNYKLWGLSR